MLGKPVAPKNQRIGRIEQSNIKVQIYTTTSRENYGQDSNFRDDII